MRDVYDKEYLIENQYEYHSPFKALLSSLYCGVVDGAELELVPALVVGCEVDLHLDHSASLPLSHHDTISVRAPRLVLPFAIPGVATGTTLSRIHLPVVLHGHEKKKVHTVWVWGRGSGLVLKIQGSPQVPHFPAFTCQWCCTGTRKKKFIQFGWGEGERLSTKDPGVTTGTTLSRIHLPVVLHGHEKKKVHTVWVGGGGAA